MESGADWSADGSMADWDRVSESERHQDRREVSLSELELDLSK
jgi:hypothetical protein